MPKPSCPRFVALDCHVQPFVATLAEYKATVAGNVADLPPVRCQSARAGVQSGAQICGRGQSLEFDRAAAGVTHDQPARFVHEMEGIGCTASTSCHAAKHAASIGVLSKPAWRKLDGV